jgi:anti-anti-sigma factor
MKLTIKSQDDNLIQVHNDGDLSQLHVRAGSPDPLDALIGSAGYSRRVLFDLSQTQFVDSSGVALMVKWNRLFRDRGGRLVFHSATPIVLPMLHLVGMKWVLTLAPDAATGRRLLQEDRLRITQAGVEESLTRVQCEGCVTALQLQILGGDDPLERALGSGGFGKRVLVDLGRVTLTDTRGLAWLGEVSGRFRDAHGKVVFHSAPATLKQALELTPASQGLPLADNEAAARQRLQEERA